MTRAAGTSECWMTDTPTNNYCTLNPLLYNRTYTGTVSNANLSISRAAGGQDAVASAQQLSDSHKDVVGLLLAEGADVGAKNEYGKPDKVT